MKSFIVLALATLTLAEPPVPSQQYLPSNQYGPPSSSYGAPGQTDAIFRGAGGQGGRPGSQYGAPRPSSQYGAPGGGYDDGAGEPANYHFEYHVQDAESGNDFGHEESRQGDVAQGKYFVLLPDGRKQIVEYTADTEGYKPKISYEPSSGGGLSGSTGYGSGPSGFGSSGASGFGGQGGQQGYNY